MTDLVVSYFLHNFFLHNQQDPNINCIFSAKPSNIVNIKQPSGTQPKRISSCFKMHKQPDALEHQKSASASASANTSSGPVPSLQNYLKMHTLLTCTTHSPFTCTLMPFNSAPSAFISPHNDARRILAYCARGSALCHTKKNFRIIHTCCPGCAQVGRRTRRRRAPARRTACIRAVCSLVHSWCNIDLYTSSR